MKDENINITIGRLRAIVKHFTDKEKTKRGLELLEKISDDVLKMELELSRNGVTN